MVNVGNAGGEGRSTIELSVPPKSKLGLTDYSKLTSTASVQNRQLWTDYSVFRTDFRGAPS